MTAVTGARQSSPGPEVAPLDPGPLLVADQLTVGFGGLLALDEVSMSVDHGEVVGRVDQHPETGAHQRLVVDYDHGNRGHEAAGIGMRASTR